MTSLDAWQRLAWWTAPVILLGAASYLLALALTKFGIDGGSDPPGETICLLVAWGAMVVAMVFAWMAPRIEPFPRTAVALYAPSAACFMAALDYTWDPYGGVRVATRYASETPFTSTVWTLFALSMIIGVASFFVPPRYARITAPAMVPLLFVSFFETFILH